MLHWAIQTSFQPLGKLPRRPFRIAQVGVHGSQAFPTKPLTDLVQCDVRFIEKVDGSVQSEVMGIMSGENAPDYVPRSRPGKRENSAAGLGLLDSCHDIVNIR